MVHAPATLDGALRGARLTWPLLPGIVVFASAAWHVEMKTRLLWRPTRFALISFE